MKIDYCPMPLAVEDVLRVWGWHQILIEHDSLNEARQWCCDNFAVSDWICVRNLFLFEKESNLIIFALKWS